MPNNPAVERISLESGGFGQPSTTLLTLQRGGVAELQVQGHARLATPSQTLRATLAPADFAVLQLQFNASGFFAMNDQYADPQLADGAWFTLVVEGGGRRKAVFSRDGAGPAELKALTTAIEALRQRLNFKAQTP